MESQVPPAARTARRTILAAPFIAAVVAAGSPPAAGNAVEAGIAEIPVDASTDASTAALLENPNSLSRTALKAAFVVRGEEWVNVAKKAEIDGTDITTALETVLVTSIRNLTLPRGIFEISRGITLTSNHRIVGAGGKNSTIIKAAPGFDAVSYPAVVTLTGTASALEHVRVDAANAPASDAIRINGIYENYVAHCQTGGGVNGLNIVAGLESRTEHSAFNGASNAGVYVQNVHDAFLLNVATADCRFGLRTVGGSTTAFHFHAIKSREHGFYLVAPGGSTFTACTADTSGKNGFHVTQSYNTRFTDCWSFKSGDKRLGNSYNWLFSQARFTTLVGCSSTYENNVSASFYFVDISKNLILVGCQSETKPIRGSAEGVQVISAAGPLAKQNTNRPIQRKRLLLSAGESGTIEVDLGYTPALAFNAKVYKVTFSGRGGNDAKLVHGTFYFTEAANTAGAGPTSRVYTYGDASAAAAKFTFALARVGAVLTATVTSTASELTTTIFEIEPFPEVV